MGLLLGVDGGGTRTRAWLVDTAGTVCGRAEAGPANYQGIGADAARAVLAEVVAGALGAGGARLEQVRYAGYGIAGADRPSDFAAIETQLPHHPAARRRRLVNDTQLALRAGTDDGIGVALVSGTGSNALGCGPDGRVVQLGGFGHELGDFGSAGDLGREALRRAMRGRDGRGEPTSLYGALCAALEVDPLEDVIDRWIAGTERPDELGALAPVVFAEAKRGDEVARRLLEQAGNELAHNAELLVDRLFAPDAVVPVVLGGSVLQAGRRTDTTLIDTIVRRLAGSRPQAEVWCLEVEPVVGAVLLAADLGGADLDGRAIARALGSPHRASRVEPAT